MATVHAISIHGTTWETDLVWQGGVEAHQVSRKELVVIDLQHLPHLYTLPLHILNAACNRTAQLVATANKQDAGIRFANIGCSSSDSARVSPAQT